MPTASGFAEVGERPGGRAAPLRHVRATMRLPSFASLSDAVKADLIQKSSELTALKTIEPETIDLAPDTYFGTLRHELSAHYLALHPLGSPAGRSRLEAAVLAEFEAGTGGLSLQSPGAFRNTLAELNLALAGDKGGWRRGTVRLSDDQEGNRILFPRVAEVPGQLERMRLLLAGSDDTPPLFSAAVAYALFLNCHPFKDGNGRTARVIINHLVRRAGMPRDVYLPLYELARRSHGGYEITLRIAEVRGEWEPFLRFILNAIHCYRDLSSAAADRVPHA